MSRKNNKNDSSKDLRGRLLSYFKEQPDRSFTDVQLARKFSAHFGRNDIIRMLYGLVAENMLSLSDTNKFKLKDAKRYQADHGKEFIGTIDMTKGGNAYVILEGTGKDIYVPSKHLNKALDGDKVKVHLMPQRGRGRMEGVVAEVIERHRTTFIGVVDLKKHCFVRPDSQHIGIDFYIPDEFINGAVHGDKVVVEMTDWPRFSRNPYAHITEVLGKAGNNDIEMRSLLVENGFLLHFSKEALQEAEALEVKIPAAEIARRKDFREVTTFTIDPLDAKDFDDALSIRPLESGNWEVGIHIADVSHYVPEGSALDKDAYKRATSVYLVDRVAPMFPEELSNIVCSLRPHEEKCCYAAVFEMDNEANVLGRWFGRTVIYSDKRFVYEEAQEIIEGKEGPFREELILLNTLAKKLKAKRFREGSVNFDSREVRFQLDAQSRPIGVFVKERKDAHMLVEDFMLLANKHVAHFVGQEMNKNGQVPFVYRVHDQPDEDKLADFALFARRLGYKVNFDNPKTISKELNRLMEQLQGKPEQNLLEQLAIRTMAKAIYTTNNIGHYGLGFTFYTHFTSPIRRYPDVMVHRILDKVLNRQALPKQEDIEAKCKHSSERERAAMDAERASVKYKMIEFMEGRMGQVFKGVISGIKSWGVYVELPEYNTEGMIRLDSFNDDKYIVDERNMLVKGIFSDKRYQLGDFIYVRLAMVDKEKKTIDFDLSSHAEFVRATKEREE
jgi:ribonuclease R